MSVFKISKFDVLILTTSLVLYTAIANAPFKAKPLGDLDFHIETKAIAGFLWGETPAHHISITKAPGPVMFYVVPYFLAGPDPTDKQYWLAGIIWTGIFITIAVFLIKGACVNFGGELAGRISILLLFILPIHLYYSLGILAEGLAFLGCSVMIYGYSRIYRQKTGYSWSLFGIGIVLLILARPNAVLLLPLLLLYFLYEVFLRKNIFFKASRKSFLITWLAIVFLIGSVMLGVKQLPNTRNSAKQESYLAYVGLIGRFQFREETWDWRFWDGDIRPDSRDYQNWADTFQRLESRRSAELSGDVYYKYLLDDIREHPWLSVKQFLVRALFAHILQVSSVDKDNFGIGPLRGKAVYWSFHALINLVNISLLVMAVLHICSNQRFHKMGVLVMPWIALIFFHGIIYMEQRYLFPTRPILVVLSALFVTNNFRLIYPLFKRSRKE